METPNSQTPLTGDSSSLLKELWFYNRKLDRWLIILQNIVTLVFSYREKVWPLFVAVAFVSFFVVPILYLSKVVKGVQLNSVLRNLVKQNLIPSWIPARRYAVFIVWLLFASPAAWLIVSLFVAQINYILPPFFMVALSIPWLLLEKINRNEYQYLREYLE